MKTSTFANRNQRGNVLFLILIAVALFAALSYAVTQSSRSGGDASKETTLINTSQLTQYPNQVRTAVLRLVINGNDPTSLIFNSPANFTGTAYEAAKLRAVFHPDGGAASWQQVPAALRSVSPPAAADWIYTLDFEIPEIGTSVSGGLAGNDLIAFAPAVAENICRRVNRELGYGDVYPIISSALTLTSNLATASGTAVTLPTTETVIAANSGFTADSSVTAAPGTTWFNGKAFGCFRNGTAGNFVYFHVLVER